MTLLEELSAPFLASTGGKAKFKKIIFESELLQRLWGWVFLMCCFWGVFFVFLNFFISPRKKTYPLVNTQQFLGLLQGGEIRVTCHACECDV